MRRTALFSLVALIGLGAAGCCGYWLLDTCRPLDRLFGISGCTGLVRIADFDPVRVVALTSPDAQGASSFFGHAKTPDGWRPAMVRLDLETGSELSRHPVRALNNFGWIALADDGDRAMFTCSTQRICTEDGRRAGIVSLADASIIETVDLDTSHPVHFPGDAIPPGEDDWRRVFAANGERIIEADRQRGILLLNSDGAEVATLIDEARWDVTVSDLSVSPSGARIAYFEHARHDDLARLVVWDALTGKAVLDRQLATGYRWEVNPAWTTDETRLTLVRRDGSDTLLELHSVPR